MKKREDLLMMVPHSPEVSELWGPLLEAYQHRNIQVNLQTYQAQPAPEDLEGVAESSSAVFLIGHADTSPQKAVNGPFLEGRQSKIPIGWLPYREASELQAFAQRAASVHLREQQEQAIALLSQRHPRFIRLIDRMIKIIPESIARAFKWTSDLLFRENMIEGLGSGLGLATYFGHGRPIGWVGYYGLRAHHFTGDKIQPMGALLSLCCKTASRKRTPISFSEELIFRGSAIASFGAVDATKHTDNTRWAVGISKALKTGVHTLADLLREAVPQNKSAREHYRIIGDPLVPITSTEESIRFANQIKTYP